MTMLGDLKTSNMTGRHRGPKQKLQADCRVLSITTTHILSMCRAVMLRKFYF